MKLTRKNAARQRAIHDAIASGKALGGLVVGFAATVAGCGECRSPADTMGSFPNPYYRENATSENVEVFVTEGDVAEPKPRTNVVNEAREGRLDRFPGEPLTSELRETSQK